MTWYRGTRMSGTTEKKTAIFSEEYPGHHAFEFTFDLDELKQQLGLYEITTEVQ